MQSASSWPVRAAIDIGSNTVHLVVARCSTETLEILEDELELVRIGESVTASGEISAQKLEATLMTLHHYKALAAKHAALEPVLVVATEAIRKARNNQTFIDEVLRQTGLQVHLIDGDVEAGLTFLGATYELFALPNAPAEVGVMDLGGGSMELVTARGRQITWRSSLPVGSGWLHDRYLPHNPPTPQEVESARAYLSSFLAAVHIPHQPPALIGTGGSANSLFYLALQAFDLDAHERKLTLEDLQRCENILLHQTAEEVALRYGQPVARAKILPAGLLIIQQVLAHCQLQELVTSPHGIREGALLAYERYGQDWLQQAKERGYASHE